MCPRFTWVHRRDLNRWVLDELHQRGAGERREVEERVLLQKLRDKRDVVRFETNSA